MPLFAIIFEKKLAPVYNRRRLWYNGSMTVKKSVLEALDLHREEYISGEKLAAKLGVSRQAIGKAISSLKADGYTILASTNRGYMLPAECDVLSAREISERTGARVLAYDSVTSTNEVAAREYLSGGECIVVSRAQTAGRKKDGGEFFSPTDRGIYFSFALPLDLPLEKLIYLRRICGNAVAQIIARSGRRRAECKHEDEVYIEGKKVAGILIECAVVAATGRTESAVIGVGVYTSQPFGNGTLASVFPEDTRNRLISDIYLRITQEIHSL